MGITTPIPENVDMCFGICPALQKDYRDNKPNLKKDFKNERQAP